MPKGLTWALCHQSFFLDLRSEPRTLEENLSLLIYPAYFTMVPWTKRKRLGYKDSIHYVQDHTQRYIHISLLSKTLVEREKFSFLNLRE